MTNSPKPTHSFFKFLHICTLLWMIVGAVIASQILLGDYFGYSRIMPSFIIGIGALATAAGTLVLGITYPIVWLVRHKQNPWTSFAWGALPTLLLVATVVFLTYIAVIEPLQKHQARQEAEKISAYVDKNDLNGFIAAQQSCGEHCLQNNQLFISWATRAARFEAIDILDRQMQLLSKRPCNDQLEESYDYHVSEPIRVISSRQYPPCYLPQKHLYIDNPNHSNRIPSSIYWSVVQAPSTTSLRSFIRYLSAEELDIALGYAVRANRPDLMAVLVKAGANTHARYEGELPSLLTIAARNNAQDAITWLLQNNNGEKLASDVADDHSKTPLNAYLEYLRNGPQSASSPIESTISVKTIEDDPQSEAMVELLSKAGALDDKASILEPLILAAQSSDKAQHLFLALTKHYDCTVTNPKSNLVIHCGKNAVRSITSGLANNQDIDQLMNNAYLSAIDHMQRCHATEPAWVNSKHPIATASAEHDCN